MVDITFPLRQDQIIPEMARLNEERQRLRKEIETLNAIGHMIQQQCEHNWNMDCYQCKKCGKWGD